MYKNQFTEKLETVTSNDFIESAVEHLVAMAAFSHISVGFLNVRLQTEYYIVENLLKGYYIWLNNDSKESILYAINKGHNLDILIDKSREIDTDFLNWLDILSKEKRIAPESSLSESELREKYTRVEFYTMLEQGQALKYGGVTRDGKKYKITISSNPNETLDNIVKEILLKYGVEKTSIGRYLDQSSELQESEKEYLRKYLPE